MCFGRFLKMFSFDLDRAPARFDPRICERCGLGYDASFRPAEGPAPRDGLCGSCVDALEGKPYIRGAQVHEVLAEAAKLAAEAGWDSDKFQEESFAHFSTFDLPVGGSWDDMPAVATPEMLNTLNDADVEHYLGDPGITPAKTLDVSTNNDKDPESPNADTSP